VIASGTPYTIWAARTTHTCVSWHKAQRSATLTGSGVEDDRAGVGDGERARRERGNAVESVSATRIAAGRYRGYAAATPPSTLSMLPVVLPDRIADAKCSTAWAMSAGSTLTPRVVRSR
jgi:hypothetical protein